MQGAGHTFLLSIFIVSLLQKPSQGGSKDVIHNESNINGAISTQVLASVIMPPLLWHANLDSLPATKEPNESGMLWKAEALQSKRHFLTTNFIRAESRI